MFIVQELQTTGQTTLLPPETYNSLNAAESAYHTKLAAAAISSVPIHTVMLYDEHGNVLRREYYEHVSP